MNSLKNSTRANRIAALLTVTMVALILVGGARARQNAVTRQDCMSNLRYWGKAFSLYSADYDNTFPTFTNDAQLETLLKTYHDDNFDSRPMRSPINGSLYHANPALSGQRDTFDVATAYRVPVLTESVPSTGKVPLVVALDGKVHQNGFPADDSVQASVDNASQLLTGLWLYLQDYDETLPYKMDNASVKNEIFPYLGTLAPFYYSPKGGEFVFNAALGGKTLATFDDPDAVVVFKTPNSLNTITGRLSGRVYVNGKPYLYAPPVPTPYDELRHARVLATGVELYIQDYDEMLPDTAHPANFKAQVLPYVRYDYWFKTLTGKDYLLNAEISGASLASLMDVSTVELFRSPELLYNGKRVIAYLDGRTRYVKE